MLKLYSFTCRECGTKYTDLCEKSTSGPEFEGTAPCPSCGAENQRDTVVAPNLASFSMMSSSDQKASLKQRSMTHSKKLMQQNKDHIESTWNNAKGVGS